MSVPHAISIDDGLEDHVRGLHRELSRLIRVYQFRDRERICCHDISVTQCWALDALVGEGPLMVNELAAHLYVDKSTMSRVVDALETKGYVRRGPHPEDGRALQVSLTDSGSRLHARIEGEILREEAALLGDFRPEVRREMVSLMARLADAAAARVETTGGRCCSV